MSAYGKLLRKDLIYSPTFTQKRGEILNLSVAMVTAISLAIFVKMFLLQCSE